MDVRERWKRLLAVLVLAELAGALESSLMFAALPTALRDYGNSVHVGWLISGYFLVAACAAAICGRLGDIYGRSHVLMAVLAIATIGSFVSLVSDSLALIVAGRSVQGFAGAVLPLCYGLAREMVPARRLSLAIGVITASGSLGAAGGFILGGVVVDAYHWQHIFTCSGLIAAAALLLCLGLLPRSKPSPRPAQSDFLGGLLFAPGLAAILWAISSARDAALLSPAVLPWFAGGSMLLMAWIRHELRHPAPLIDVRLMARRPIMIANLAVVFGTLGAVQILQIFPVLMQQPLWTGVGFGLSATLVGVLKLPSNLASVAGSSLGGAFSDRFGNRIIVILGATLCLSGWLGLYLEHRHLWLAIAEICLSSAGATMLLAGAIATIVRHVPQDRTSEATGITIVTRTICQAIGGQIVIVLLATDLVRGAGTESFPSPAAYDLTFAYVAAMCAAALAAALALQADRPARAVPSDAQLP